MVCTVHETVKDGIISKAVVESNIRPPPSSVSRYLADESVRFDIAMAVRSDFELET